MIIETITVPLHALDGRDLMTLRLRRYVCVLKSGFYHRKTIFWDAWAIFNNVTIWDTSPMNGSEMSENGDALKMPLSNA